MGHKWNRLLNKLSLLNKLWLLNWHIRLCQWNLRINKLWLLNHRLLNGAVSFNHRFLYGLVINESFNSLLWNIFNFSFISILWNIFGDVFDLLVISISLLNWSVFSLFDSLIFSNCFGDWDIFGFLLCDIFNILSFIRYLLLGNYWFVISVGFFNWDIFDIWGGLWGWLLVNKWLWGYLLLNILNLGLNNGLNKGLLINNLWLLWNLIDDLLRLLSLTHF